MSTITELCDSVMECRSHNDFRTTTRDVEWCLIKYMRSRSWYKALSALEQSRLKRELLRRVRSLTAKKGRRQNFKHRKVIAAAEHNKGGRAHSIRGWGEGY